MPFVRLQFRRSIASDWALGNPLLAIGEMGIESDTELFKIGDGVRLWNDLPYGGLRGPTGPASMTGAGGTGYTGPTGSSDKFLTSTTTSILPNPVQGGTITLTVGTLAYIPGNSVIVVDSTNYTNSFGGRVQSYSGGTLVIDSIKNIQGTFSSVIYNVNLNGGDGATGPTGPSGSVLVYSVVFDGGNSANSYIFGPAFDCGSSV